PLDTDRRVRVATTLQKLLTEHDDVFAVHDHPLDGLVARDVGDEVETWFGFFRAALGAVQLVNSIHQLFGGGRSRWRWRIAARLAVNVCLVGLFRVRWRSVTWGRRAS